MSLAALRDAHRPAMQKAALAVGGGVAAAAIGYGASHSWQALAMATGAIASLGFSLAGSWLLPIAAIPAAFVDARLPLGSGSLSVADLAVVLGAMGAAVHLDWRSNRRLIPVLVALVLYEVTLGLGVVGNPGLAAVLELAHRATIVGGSLVIGAYLVQREKVGLALGLFVVTAAVIGAAAIADAVMHGMQPAFPLGLQKNYAGSLLSSALIASFVLRPTRARLGILLRISQLVVALGLLATQSRGALLGLAVGTLVFSLVARKHRLLVISGFLIAAPVLVLSVGTDLLTRPQFGPAATRLANANAAIVAWRQAPFIGNGIRYFADATSGLLYDPHNVVLLTLAESGLAGLAGLAVLLGVAIVQLWRIRTLLATAGLALLVGRFAHGLVDIYWVHGSQEIPWLMMGMALGTTAGMSHARAAIRHPGVTTVPLAARAGGGAGPTSG